LNVFGCIECFLDGDVVEGASALVRLARARDTEEGPLVGVLKPRAWAGNQVLYEPLLAAPEGKENPEVPNIAYARDGEQAVAYLKDANDFTLEQLREHAQAHLRSVEVQFTQVGGEDSQLWVVSGHFYAAEKLLERTYATRLHKHLGADMLLVGLPARGVGVVRPLHDPVQDAVLMHRFIEKVQADCVPSDRISPLVFLMQQGAISGYVSMEKEAPEPDPAREPEQKKSWWKRLIH